MAVILIVDDEIDNISVMEYALTLQGHIVIGIENPSLALSAVEEHQPDLIVMDMRLPYKYDGMYLGEQIRREIAPDTPMIAVTAAVLSYNRDDVLAVGFDEYVERPCGVMDLRELIGLYTT